MGASEQLTKKLKQTINEEAEVLLADKRRASGAVNIKTNEERMKVGAGGAGGAAGWWCCWLLRCWLLLPWGSGWGVLLLPL